MADPYNSALPLPVTLLKPEETKEAKSDSSSSVYKMKRVSDHYSCTCPAWRIQKGVATDARTCKHLRSLLGNPYEDARIKLKLGSVAPYSTSVGAGTKKKRAAPDASTSTSKAKKAKKSKDDKEEEEDADDVSSGGAADAPKQKKKVEVLLAKKFELDGKKDPKGWWMSEKLDGIRAYWDGQGTLWSRLGNPFHAPNWFIKKLPQGKVLDGELFHSRNNFNATTSIVRSHSSEKWNEIRYKVFDIPSLSTEPFEARLEHLQKLFPPDPPAPTPAATAGSSKRSDYKWVQGGIVDVVEQTKCEGLDHLLKVLKEVEKSGGEGLMLREPKSIYVGTRSGTLLKVKTFFDAEAKVIGYEPGKGKYKGQTGSLLCEMESKKTFNVGSGLSDADRVKPPKIGAIISYRFQEVTKDLVPRFPSFVGERLDCTVAKDADVSGKTADKKSDDDE